MTFFKRTYNLTNDQFTALLEKIDADLLDKPFEELKRMQKIEILFAVAGLGQFDVCLLKDFADLLSEEEWAELITRFETINRRDKLFISIVTNGREWKMNKDNEMPIRIGMENNKYIIV